MNAWGLGQRLWWAARVVERAKVESGLNTEGGTKDEDEP